MQFMMQYYNNLSSDKTLTVDNVLSVMSQLNPATTELVWEHLGMPSSRYSPVRELHRSSEHCEHMQDSCSYYVNVHPNSVSWNALHKCLYQLGETDALQRLTCISARNQKGKTF